MKRDVFSLFLGIFFVLAGIVSAVAFFFLITKESDLVSLFSPAILFVAFSGVGAYEIVKYFKR